MAKTFDLSVVFKVVDQASGKFDKIGMAVGRMSANLQKATGKLTGLGSKLKDFGSKTKGIGKNLATKLSLPLAGFAALAGKTAVAFDKSMNKVSAVTGATGEDFKRLSDRAREMGSTTQFTASESAEAMTFLGMAGLNTKQVYEALPGVLQLAAASGLDLASAADIATNVMTSMSLKVSDLAHINDVLAFTANNANTDVRQLAEALRPVASTADSLGVSLEEVSADLAKMADAGEKGGAAGTFLRNAMIAVVKPTDKAKEAFTRMGINIKDFVTDSGKLKNFSGMMELIQAQGAKVEDVFDAFGVRGARAVLTLTKKGKNLKEFTNALKMSSGAMDQETKDMLKNLKALGVNTDAYSGAADKAKKAMEKGLPGAINSLKAAIEALFLSIKESGIGESVESFIRKAADIFRWFSKLNPSILKMASIVGILVAVLGPLLILIGMMTTALGFLSAVSLPLVGSIAAIAVVFGLLLKFADPVIAVIGAITAAMLIFSAVSAPVILIAAGIAAVAWLIIKNWTPIVNFFSDTFSSIWEMIKLVGESIMNYFKSWDPIGWISEAFEGLSDFIGGIFSDALDSLPNPLKKLFGVGPKASINVSGAVDKNKNSKSETDVRVKVDMPAQLTGTITSKKQKGENSKVTVKLNNVFAGPTLQGVQ